MRRVGRTLVLVGVIVAAMAATAGGAQALPQVTGPVTKNPPSPNPAPAGLFLRGGGAAPINVLVGATEGATFGFATPNNAISSAGSCSTSLAGATCISFLSMGSVVVVVGTDGDATLDEPLFVFLNPSVAAPSGGVNSVEGSGTFSSPAALFAGAKGVGLTTGEVSGVITAALLGNAALDAQIAITTTAPAGGNMVPQGDTLTYSATLNRGGVTTGQTDVGVSLLASGAPNGTSVVGSSQQQVTFAPGETGPKNVSFDVLADPCATTPGNNASYFFKASYDPIGTDGVPIDTETGATKTFTIIAGPTGTCDSSGDQGSTGASSGPTTTTTNQTPVGKNKCKKKKKKHGKKRKCKKKKHRKH